MKIILKLILLTWSMAPLSVLAASACVQDNNELTRLVGLDSAGGGVYVNVESSSNECSCNHFRFRPANTDTQMALSILLSAKMASKEVRIDLLESGNCDSAYRVYIE